MPKVAQNCAILLGVAVFAAACGSLEPSADGGTGAVSVGTSSTTGAAVDAVTAGTSSTTGANLGAPSASTTGTTGGTASGGSGTSTGGSGTSTGGTASGGTVTGGGNACTPDGWDNYAQAKFSSACSNCHAISFSTLAQVLNDKTAVEDRIKSKNMPKNSTLDSDTYTRLVKWMDCGLPQ